MQSNPLNHGEAASAQTSTNVLPLPFLPWLVWTMVAHSRFGLVL